jgi:hypothetical protein
LKRHVITGVLAVLALAAANATIAPAAESTTSESGNPINDQGSSYHYRTYVTSITPNVPGLSIEVLEFADRLLLRNHTGKPITIFGYSGEPYARILPGGAAEQNVRSPAVYLNTNFYANVTVPASASASAPPRWAVVDRTGQFEWHDHRIHWMSPVTPPEVKDPNKTTKIFDWRVPIEVGNQPGAISGELFWVPASSRAPTGVIAAFVAIILVLLATALYVRRRRGGRPPGGGATASPLRDGGDGPAADAGAREAW